MVASRAELRLPPLVAENTDDHGTAFTVSVDLSATGTGVSAGHKIRAYARRERGSDMVDANTAQGLPVDSRSYGVGAQILGVEAKILADLEVRRPRLITNNPAKYGGLVALRARHHRPCRPARGGNPSTTFATCAPSATRSATSCPPMLRPPAQFRTPQGSPCWPAVEP